MKSLTDRQKQVLKAIAENWTTKQIADDLGLTLGGIDYHRMNIIRKLGQSGTAYLTQWALKNGVAKWIV